MREFARHLNDEPPVTGACRALRISLLRCARAAWAERRLILEQFPAWMLERACLLPDAMDHISTWATTWAGIYARRRPNRSRQPQDDIIIPQTALSALRKPSVEWWCPFRRWLKLRTHCGSRKSIGGSNGWEELDRIAVAAAYDGFHRGHFMRTFWTGIRDE